MLSLKVNIPSQVNTVQAAHQPDVEDYCQPISLFKCQPLKSESRLLAKRAESFCDKPLLAKFSGEQMPYLDDDMYRDSTAGGDLLQGPSDYGLSPVKLERPRLALTKCDDGSSLSAESGGDYECSPSKQAHNSLTMQLKKLSCHNSCRLDMFMDEFSVDERSMHNFLDELDLNMISLKTVIEENNTAYKSPAVKLAFAKQSQESNSPNLKLAKRPSLWQRRNMATIGKKLSINSFAGISTPDQPPTCNDKSESANEHMKVPMQVVNSSFFQNDLALVSTDQNSHSVNLKLRERLRSDLNDTNSSISGNELTQDSSNKKLLL